MATIFGTIIGAVAGGIAGLFMWMLITGGGIAIIGFGLSSVKRSEWDSDRQYIIWLAVGICALAVGLMSCVGAIIGLYFHQIGFLLIFPIAGAMAAGKFFSVSMDIPVTAPPEPDVNDIRILAMYKKLNKLKDPEHQTLGEMDIDLAIHVNSLCGEFRHVKQMNYALNAFMFGLITISYGLIWWLVQLNIPTVG